MSNLDKIKEVEYRIKENKKSLRRLDECYLKHCGPEGYKSGTSYNDYDVIHGSRKEQTVERYLAEKERLIAMIELDEQILSGLIRTVNIKEYLNMLEDNKQKVKFLRIVKELTQQQTSELIGISVRQVQRIEKKIKMS